ncbi:hypothetical protein P8452_03602 [Trifolium repens]|nr:hypothetical protein P8452_03602 [Trifolium repens]
MVYNEKRKVELEVDDLADILAGKENVRIRVQIVRLWKVPSFVNPSDSISLEMVLVDEKGGKIHASVRKQLIYMFESKLEEGHKLLATPMNMSSWLMAWCGYGASFQHLHLVDARKQVKKEPEAFLESRYLNWKNKEHTYQSFLNQQFGAFKELKALLRGIQVFWDQTQRSS